MKKFTLRTLAAALASILLLTAIQSNDPSQMPEDQGGIACCYDGDPYPNPLDGKDNFN